MTERIDVTVKITLTDGTVVSTSYRGDTSVEPFKIEESVSEEHALGPSPRPIRLSINGLVVCYERSTTRPEVLV